MLRIRPSRVWVAKPVEAQFDMKPTSSPPVTFTATL